MNNTGLILPELLAPAGGPEAGYAAIHYGADALYVGLRRFSARAGAVNFSPDELADITGYAHAQAKRRKIYVTLNTVTLDRELPELVPVLADIAAAGADGVIVQDLGVARLVREHFPRLELHASTQMAIHNLAGAQALRELGFMRVNLARELTLAEIRTIVAESGLEVEVFIHGALCYCYSGMCLMSSHMYGRSGNRGSCAYPCREWFNLESRPGNGTLGLPGRDATSTGGLMFSMKDLALPDRLPELCAAGVASLKIEGRMKSPLYVAAVTDFYRRLLDGKLGDPEERAAAEEDLRTIFSRHWTTLYAESAKNRDVIDPDQTGHRGAPVGLVATAVPAPRLAGGGAGVPRSLRFRTSRELELHDGLQVDIPGTSRPYGFALDEFRIAVGPAVPDRFHVPAGVVVEIPLPPDAPAIPADVQVYCASSQRVKRTFAFQVPRPGEFRERLPVAVTVTLAAGKMLLAARTLPRFAGEVVAEIVTELVGEFTAARNLAGTETAVRDAFSRLGDTRFTLAELELRNPHGLFAPASVLNHARRQLAAKLDAVVQEAADERVDDIVAATSRPRGPLPGLGALVNQPWSLFVERAEYVAEFAAADWDGLEELIIDIGGATLPELEWLRNLLGHDRLRLALPPVVRSWEEPELRKNLADLRHAGFVRFLVAGVGQLPATGLAPVQGLPATGLAPVEGAIVSGPGAPAAAVLPNHNHPSTGTRPVAKDIINTDWPVPTFNRGTILQLLEMGVNRACLSPEDGAENMQRLLAEFGDRLTVVAYQDTPLMISESCPSAALAGGRCRGDCPPEREEVGSSKKGENFLICQKKCRTFVLHQKPFCLAGQVPELTAAGGRHFRADFRYRRYTPAEVRRLWTLLRDGQHLPHTRNGNWGGGI